MIRVLVPTERSSKVKPSKPIQIPKKMIEAWQDAVRTYSPRARGGLRGAIEMHSENLKGLWRIYTEDRKNLGRIPATDVRVVGPYLLGFHFSNWARIRGLFIRAEERGLTLSEGHKKVRIIDLGCGTGAAHQACADWLGSDRQMTFELIDRSKHLVACAEGMIKSLSPDSRIRTLVKDIVDPTVQHLHRKWQADAVDLNIILMSYVWNEIAAQSRPRGIMLETLLSWARNPRPTVLVVSDPANEIGSKAGMKLRNFLNENDWQIAYPCPKNAVCPMSQLDRDWCYSEFDYSSPKEMTDIERRLGVSRQRLGTSGYVFVNAAYQFQRNTSAAVVVGKPKVGRETALLLCDGEQIQRQEKGLDLARGVLFINKPKTKN